MGYRQSSWNAVFVIEQHRMVEGFAFQATGAAPPNGQQRGRARPLNSKESGGDRTVETGVQGRPTAISFLSSSLPSLSPGLASSRWAAGADLFHA
jgi:hypothetical protein